MPPPEKCVPLANGLCTRKEHEEDSHNAQGNPHYGIDYAQSLLGTPKEQHAAREDNDSEGHHEQERKPPKCVPLGVGHPERPYNQYRAQKTLENPDRSLDYAHCTITLHNRMTMGEKEVMAYGARYSHSQDPNPLATQGQDSMGRQGPVALDRGREG